MYWFICRFYCWIIVYNVVNFGIIRNRWLWCLDCLFDNGIVLYGCIFFEFYFNKLWEICCNIFFIKLYVIGDKILCFEYNWWSVVSVGNIDLCVFCWNIKLYCIFDLFCCYWFMLCYYGFCLFFYFLRG